MGNDIYIMDKEVYFHVGLGKTASTFLQEQVFPYFTDIEYIHRNYRYQKVDEVISKSEQKKIFVSREFDQQFEEEVVKFSKHHPDTTAIIVFRRQGPWIASQYRRFFKNGHMEPFPQFFDLKKDSGRFKKHDLHYQNYLRIIEENFTKKPLVLFYEDLRKDPLGFIDTIAQTMGVSYNITDINLKPRHSSYSEKQLQFLKVVGEKVDLTKEETGNLLRDLFRRFYTNMIRYNTLFIAKLLPDSWFTSSKLINPKFLDEVDDFYEKDWLAIKEYAMKNNP
jgi:hypothetical protein